MAHSKTFRRDLFFSPHITRRALGSHSTNIRPKFAFLRPPDSIGQPLRPPRGSSAAGRLLIQNVWSRSQELVVVIINNPSFQSVSLEPKIFPFVRRRVGITSKHLISRFIRQVMDDRGPRQTTSRHAPACDTLAFQTPFLPP